MHGVETFRLAQTQMQHFHRAQLEAGVSDSLNDVTGMARAHRVRLDDREC
jgi:hypothetical protein